MPTDPNDTQQTPAAQATLPKQGRMAALAGGLLSGMGKAIKKRRAGSTLAPVASPSNEALAAEIEQVALESGTPLATIVAMLAGQTQDVEQVIATFDEEKEHAIGRVISIVATLFCYIMPWLIAFYAGSALGYTYSGHVAFDFRQTQTAFYYLVSWAYEFGLVSLMIAMVRQFKRVRGGNRRGIAMLITLLVLFLVLAVTSASAQWILFEHAINPSDRAQLIGALFRTLGTPLTDLTCAIVLAVLYAKSLEQHLDVIQKKNDATIAINRKKIQSRLEVISAAMEVKNTLQKEEDYQQKNALANTIIGLMSEHAIDAIRDSLAGKKQDTGSSFRRDTYR